MNTIELKRNCSWIELIRQPKIFNMAIFDWASTLLASFIIAKLLFRILDINKYKVSFILFYFYVTILLLILGIFLHIFFDVNTMLGYYLGISKKPKRIKCI